jgi:membrane associated rhomboid family serine protease
MGIQDRDYYREGPSFLDRVGQQGTTVWLVAITCGVFFGQVLSRDALTQLWIYNPKLILEGEVWRLVTPMFLHAGLLHLFFNMLVLFWAGQRVEDVYGAREFGLFYLAAGISAHVIYLAAYLAGLCPVTNALGASGAVFAVLVLFALHFPHQKILLFMIVPVPAWALVLMYVALDLMGALGARGDTHVAFLVHLGGAFFGFLYYASGWRFTSLFARAPASTVRPKLRVVPPPVEEREPEPVGAPVQAAPHPAEAADEQLEAKLDAVLAKVSKHGQESLTPEEREILFRASELFKKRRK